MMTDEEIEAGFRQLAVVEDARTHAIERAIVRSRTFQVLIGQSGNDAFACARDIARDVRKETG